MSIQKKSLIGGIIGVIVAFALIAGGTIYFTGSFFGLGASSTGGSGTLQVFMQDPPQVPAGVTDVYINYTGIEVHISNASGSQSGWYPVTTGTQSINLTSIVADSKLLGSTTLPAGTYNLVRFNVTSAVVTYNGVNYTAKVTSGMVQAALTGVSVKSGATSALLIDISPTVQGTVSAGFTLVPSANAMPTTLSAAGAGASNSTASRSTP
jgi:Domain of unknown function (DUF4382)